MFKQISFISSLFAFLLLAYFAREVTQVIPAPKLENQDIYYSYVEGKRLRDGKNPYERVLHGNMLENQKYATYFPVFYELSYISQAWGGLKSAEAWIIFWKSIFVWFELGVGALLFGAFAQRRLEWFGVFAAAFWLFNRWTLKVVEMSNLDFIPIFFLVLSLLIFPRHRWWSLLLFSLSLGFKQIAIFLAPLYLVWIWRDSDAASRWKNSALAILCIISVPLISGLPFLVWNAEGFIKSILFSATRYGSNQFEIPSLDQVMGWHGLSGRLVMIGLMASVYFIALRGYGKKFIAAILVMSIFLDYNAVLYSQYPSWLVPLIPLALLDLFSEKETEPASPSPATIS